MFKWNVEEMKLMNQKKITDGSYPIEHQLSREEKIAFVDEMQDNKLSYFLSLVEKFKKDKETLPNTNGRVKTVSLKSWINKNDTKYGNPILNISSDYGDFYLLGTDTNINIYERHDDFIDKVFHNQLYRCEMMEKNYFAEHDEYSILKKQFLEKKHITTFGIQIAWSSNNEVKILNDNGDEKRDITIEELKELLALYEKLENYEKELSKSHSIKF